MERERGGRMGRESYDRRGAYIGINIYDIIQGGVIHGGKCTCNV
jgi:hypothetical protein